MELLTMRLNESPFGASYAPRPEKPIVALKPKAWSVFLSWKNLRGIIFIIPLFSIAWQYLTLQRTEYMFTTQRFRTITGLFNQEIDEVWLFRVTDLRILKPFLYRLFGIANLCIYSTDRNNKLVVIQAISLTDALKLHEILQQQVNIERHRNRPDIPGSWQ
ncbi:PH domain-containing protein [Microcystis aeruginosa]|uniref:PH domain-containing protein n=1 Tax=Microcystis aeruginosa TaxID=1126 RepID=UPI001EEFE5AA|nr:PH domain-containing protein [Microcystis aeruginosa]